MGPDPSKDAIQLAAINSNVLPPAKRPKPPADLGRLEAELWRGIVEQQDPKWATPATLCLLKAFVITSVRFEEFELQFQELQRTMPFDPVRFGRMQRTQASMIKTLEGLARSMRLSPFSQPRPRRPTDAVIIQEEDLPWNFDGA